METRSKVFGESEPLNKAKGAAKRQSEHQKISKFSACKTQGNQHEISIAFVERDSSLRIQPPLIAAGRKSFAGSDERRLHSQAIIFPYFSN